MDFLVGCRRYPPLCFGRGPSPRRADRAPAYRRVRRARAVRGRGTGPEDSHRRKAYALLALSLRRLGQCDASRDALLEGLSHTPDDPELHFHLAHLLTEEQAYAPARAHYLQVLDADITQHFSSVDIGILGYKTLHNLGGLGLLTDDYAEAKKWFGQAIAEAPQFLPSAFALFDAALQNDDYVTARRMLSLVEAQEGRDGHWPELGVRYAEKVGGAENGALFLEQAIRQHPEAVGPALQLTRRLLQAERTREALPLLQRLDRQQVPEATYCLGIASIRAGALPEALQYMERALRLRPDHAQTREQAQSLRQALGLDLPTPADGGAREAGTETHAGQELEAENAVVDMPSSPAVSLDIALAQLAVHFGLETAPLQAYAAEDTLGGYARETGGELTPHDAAASWPGGSVWEGEGQTLYALARALKPHVIVEIGSLVGCSTSHLALACLRNGSGTVYAVDPHADFGRVRADLLPCILPVPEDVFTWTPPAQIDFVFEDGAHTPGFTRRVLERLKPYLAPHAAVFCHDACRQDFGGHILPELRAAAGGHAESVLIHPSDCGLGFARCQAEA